jgi:hypothetical protein
VKKPRRNTAKKKQAGRLSRHPLRPEGALVKARDRSQSREDTFRDQWQRNEAELQKLSAVPQDKLKPYFQRIGELLCEQEFIENELSMDGPSVSQRWSGKF